MIKAVVCLLLTASLLVWFQNCGEQMNQDPDGGVQTQDKVVVAVGKANYVEVNFQQRPGFNSEQKLTVNLENQTLTLNDENGNQTSCDLPEDVNNELTALLTNVQICEPAPLGPDEVTCMAIGAPDIELKDTQDKTEWLQPSICNTGRFLCNGGDVELRRILTDISCE